MASGSGRLHMLTAGVRTHARGVREQGFVCVFATC